MVSNFWRSQITLRVTADYVLCICFVHQKTKRLYTGSTKNLKQRLQEHNEGMGGKFSRMGIPYMLVFYEAFLSKTDARKQELFYKSGYGREVLKGKLVNSFKLMGA